MADTVFLGGDIQKTISGNTNFATRYDNSVSALTGGGYVISWVEDPDGAPTPDGTDVFVQRFNADGSEAGIVTRVNATLAGDQESAAIAGLTGGSFVVAWTSDVDGGVYMQRYDALGVALGAETRVNTSVTGLNELSTVTALSTGGYIITWYRNINNGDATLDISICYQRYDVNGVAQGSEGVIATETVSEYLDTGFPRVEFYDIETTELTGGNIVLTWTRGGISGNPVAQMAQLNSSGVLQGSVLDPEQTADQYGTGPQQHVVALGNGNVLVIYGYTFGATGLNGVGYGEVFGRIYDANGLAVDDEFVIASSTTNRRFDLFAGSDGKGGAMVGWVQEADTLNERVIELQQVTQDGTLVGDTIWAFPHSAAQDMAFDIAALPNGNLVVTGQNGGAGSFSDIQHRLILDGTDARFTSGVDVVVLGAAGETVAALEGGDTVTGGAGRDFISGGAGVDTLLGNAANDVIHGGADRDTIRGGTEDDLLFGDGEIDTIYGDAGVDTIDGGEGNDILRGGAGNDTIYGGGGNDNIDGGSEDDYIYGNRGQWQSLGPDEVDHDETTANTLNGGTGNDHIYGGHGNDIINGNDGDDFLYGNEYRYVVSGDDLFNASNGNDRIDGYDGFDTLDYSVLGRAITMSVTSAGTSNEHMLAQVAAFNIHPVYTQDIYGVEKIIGSLFADVMVGDLTDNTFVGLTGADNLDGGAGSDTLDYSASHNRVQVDIAANTATGGHANGDIIQNFENITGSNLNDVLTGNTSTNRLLGLNGDDLLAGGAGADFLDGGNNTDIADYRASTGTNVSINLLLDTASGGFADGDSLDNIENLYGSTAQRDILIGNDSNNTIYGFGGDDSLRGEDGDDFLEGGAGADSLNAGAGTSDTVSYRDNTAANVNVNLLANTYSGGDAQGDTLFFVENLEGSLTLRDILVGNNIANRLIGNGGDDSLRGEGNNDFMDGGAGADSLNGGSGIDTVSYLKSTAGVTIDLNVALQVSAGDADGDNLNFFENVEGSELVDSITGNYAVNRLYGFSGSDTLNGALGSDYLTGGADADTFRFSDANFGTDRITDFEDGIDIISVDLALAVSVATLTFTVNSTTSVTVRGFTGGGTIVVESANAITVDAADFVFV